MFKEELKTAKTVIWNGPLGVYEFDNYKEGTEELLKYLVNNNIKTILGGGDIVAAASNCNLKDKVFHASTGGGSTLEYLEGKKLPGIESIKATLYPEKTDYLYFVAKMDGGNNYSKNYEDHLKYVKEYKDERDRLNKNKNN